MGFSLGSVGGDLLGSVVSGGINLIGSKYQTDLQQKANKESYERERSDALSDWDKEKAYNQDLWNRNNEYNSPLSQMQRLREAGLNPNLMYGQGTTGQAAVVKAGDISHSSMGRAEVDRPRLGIEDYLALRRQGLLEETTKEHVALLKANRARVLEETRGVRRENDLLEKTFSSGRDPWYIRGGGRFLRLLLGLPAGDNRVVPSIEPSRKDREKAVQDFWDGLNLQMEHAFDKK